MVSIQEILKKRLLDMVKNIQPAGRWKIVVVDSKSARILSSSCKMYDILEENVTLVENIEKNRQPYPNLEAIYFLTPCQESINRLIDDFSGRGGPMYSAAHLHFTSGLNDRLFSDLNSNLKATGANRFVRSLKEMYVDFLAVESSVYQIEPPTAFFNLYASEAMRSGLDEHIENTAKQLLSVIATLGEHPQIRYHRPLDVEGTVNRAISYKLAMSLQKELDEYQKLNGFPPRDSGLPPPTVLILDRTLDPTSPLLHEFTYQAMIYDLLQNSLDGNKYSYTFTESNGNQNTAEVTLDETDELYRKIRHLHIAETTDRLIAEFQEFSGQKAFQSRDESSSKGQVQTLRDMRDVISGLPQLQEQKAKYSAHISIAQDCMNVFEKSKLSQIGGLEQNIACGETADGEIPKTIIIDMVPLLDDPYTSNVDKTRLLMLYIISKEGGVLDEDRRKLLEHARITPELKDAITNLALLGVQLSRQANRGEKSKKKKDRKKNRGEDEVPFELSRWVPVTKRAMENHCQDTLDRSLYPFTREPERETRGEGDAGAAQRAAVSLRTTKPSWHKKTGRGSVVEPRAPAGPRLIVFIAGGLTYSEIRSAYEIADVYNREVYIGSTALLTPTKFVDDLSQLRRPVPSPPSIIPPYVPPSAPSPPSSVRSAPPATGPRTVNSGNTASAPQTPSVSPMHQITPAKKDKKFGFFR